MSGGHLEWHGEVEDWEVVKAYLLDSSWGSSNLGDDDNWSDNDWGWPVEEEAIPENLPNESCLNNKEQGILPGKPDFGTRQMSWLDECSMAFSPAGDIFAIALGPKAVFFKGDCNIGTNRMIYTTCFQGVLSEEEGEFVTSIACIPLVSQKKSSPGAPDWTCVVAGFNDGYMRVYNETGNLLISQQFHNERIMSFKIRSFVPSRIPLQHDQLEEIFVLYRSVLVTMDGFGFFQTLRACRNHLARLKANATEAVIEPPPLLYKKWGFEVDQTISDCEVVGLNTPSTFDHLFTASLLGGLYAKQRQNPPTASVLITVGLNPFVGFYHAHESQATPVLAEMAYAVASKVKSSILNAASGWLGFGLYSPGNSTAKPLPKETKNFEPATPLDFRFKISDAQREGKCILASPARNLSVVTDSLGRITLLDNFAGIAIRMWKGYREAQCSWLQVEEHVSSKGKGREARVALFLVVYAPRRGMIEVFAMQQGPKVASFNVNRHGRLISITYGMMGLNDASMRGGQKSVLECLFVDCEGKIFTLNIPFHLGLCDKTSSKAKDVHLLKALQKLVRDGQYTASDLNQILVEIRTPSMVNQAFKILTQRCSNVEVLTEVVQSYMQTFCDQDDKDLTVVFRIMSLLELYKWLVSFQTSPPAFTSKDKNDSKDDKTLLYWLHASEKETTLLKKLGDEESQSRLLNPKAVTFSDSKSLSLPDFFGSFAIEFDPNKIKASNQTNPNSSSELLLNFKSDGIDRLGRLLLCGCLNGTAELSDWGHKLRNVAVDPHGVLLLVFRYWCQNPVESLYFVSLLEKLYHVVKTLCELKGYEGVISNFHQVSKWWEAIRKELMQTPKIFQIYSFAIICRGVAIDLQRQREAENVSVKGEKSDEDMNISTKENSDTSSKSACLEFENISLDLLKWNILIKQIEDLSLLSSVLSQKPLLEVPQLPVIAIEAESLTVIKLLDKGKGCIAELVGRWLTTIGIDPNLIQCALDDEETDAKEKMAVVSKKESFPVFEIENADEAVEGDKSINHVLDLLRYLKINFSVSLSSSIMLSNYCWEYCLEWKNETNKVEFLSAAIKCASAISSPFVRQGMLSMMWNIFLCKKFATIAAISKTTQEKLADKPSGFSSPEKKVKFARECVVFLDLFMETNSACEVATPPANLTLLKNHWSSEVNTNASLTDLALAQPYPKFEMLLLHYQLALCTEFFYAFRLKGTMKPTNLFDTQSRILFFQNLQNPAPFSNVEVDLTLKTLREEFLCLVLSCAVRGIPIEPVIDSSSKAEVRNVTASEAGVKIFEDWNNKCTELARLWGQDLDVLRTSYVCELFSNGFDSLGFEAVRLVQERDVLGTKLLLIAGMRVSYFINQKRENVSETVSSISTNLSKWLDSLDYSSLRSLRFSKDSIVELVQQVLQLIPESNYDYRLAEELLLASSFV